DDREKTGVALDHARQGVEMARPSMAAELGPAGLRLAGRLHRAVDVRGRSWREPGQHLAGRGLERIEMRLAIDPFAANEMAETLVVAPQPGAPPGPALRGGAPR